MGNYAGLIINGVANDGGNAGYSVDSIGDINGDGIEDIAISSPFTNIYDPTNESTAFDRGAVFVVFGQSGNAFPTEIDLADLDGSDGFQITPQLDLTDGIYGGSLYSGGLARFGKDVTGLGDVNGDGIDDFGIVQRASDSTQGYYVEGGTSDYRGIEGVAYVVFGGQQPYDAVEDITGLAGFRIDATGYMDSIVALGDVNGDGIDDVGVNAVDRYTGNTLQVDIYTLYDYDGNGVYDAGTNDTVDIYTTDVAVGQSRAFVIYGTDQARASETPIAEPDNSGGFYGVALANGELPVNATTIADTIVNTELMDGSDGFTVITGSTATSAYGFNGYYGAGSGNIVGSGLQSMGDFDGDGFADIMVEESSYFIGEIRIIRSGPPDFTVDGMGSEIYNATSGNYLIYGGADGPGAGISVIDISVGGVPNGVDFVLSGFATFDDSRAPIGDVSGLDGLGEVAFGAYYSAENDPIAGLTQDVLAITVVNGTAADPLTATADPATRTLVAQDVIDGQGAIYYDASSVLSDTAIGLSGDEVRGVGDINNDGVDDFLLSGFNFGELDVSDTQKVMYLVFGQDTAVTGLFELGAMVAAGDAYRIDPIDGTDFSLTLDIAAAGDFNGDGIDDILIGEGNSFNFGSNQGRGIIIFGDGLEAADNADGTDDNTISLANLNVDIVTGLRPTEIRFEDAGFFGVVANEGDSGTTNFTFNVLRTGDLSETVTVDFQVTGTGASPATADDFVGGVFPSGVVTFTAGSDTATITVPVQGDGDREDTEDFSITLSNPTTDGVNALLITGAETFGRIVNEDLPAQVQINYFAANALEDTPASEDDAGSRFTIFRNGDIGSAVTIEFEVSEYPFGTSNGLASAGDLLGYKFGNGAPINFAQTAAFPLTGSVTLAPGETNVVLSILPNPDLDIELAERFQVTLTDATADGPQGAEILANRDTGYGTILNDDFDPGVLLTVVSEPSSNEGTNASGVPVNEIVFTLTKQGQIADAVDVVYNLNTGSVVAPFAANQDDFVGVTFPANSVLTTLPAGVGTSVEIRLPVNPDAIIEPREYVQMEIVNVSGAPGVVYDVPFQSRGVNIRNDDGRPAVPEVPFDVNGDGVIDPDETIPVEADVFGDPHITTLDGLGYDFQTVGEFILVETDAAATNPFAVQVRFEPFPGSDVVSVTTRMAVEVNGATIEIDALGANPILINGAAPSAADLAIGGIDVDSDGQFDVEFDSTLGEFTIYLNTLSDGAAEQLKVGIFDGSLNICVFLGDPAAGGNAGAVQGLMGNANADLSDDFALRDGSTVPGDQISTDANGVPSLEFEYLYGAYADSWRIDAAERDFTDTAPDFPANFPAAAFTLDDLPDAIVEAATQAALDAGLDPADNQVIFDAAVLDFALTGSEAFFDSAQVLVAEPEAASSPTGAPVTPATVGVSAVTSAITEGDTGSQTLTFTFYRGGDTSGAIDVDYSVGGDADASDLASGTALTGTVSFADGEDTKSISIDVTGDLANEADEDLVVAITGTSIAGTLVAASQGITTIETDDFAPVAADDGFTTDEDTTVIGNLFTANPTDDDTDADGDTFTITAVNGVAGAANGNRIILPSGAHVYLEEDGGFEYRPFGFADSLSTTDSDFDALNDGEVGSDSFTYTIADGNGGDDTATVSINVTGMNDAPNAVIDEFSVDENGTVSGNVLTGEGSITGPDTDPEGDPLTVTQIGGVNLADADEDATTDGTQVTFGDGGTVTIAGNGDVSYNTNGAFEQLGENEGQLVSRLQSIEITISDDSGATDTSALRFSVTGTNDAPVGQDDIAATQENTPVEILYVDLLANDTDVDSSGLFVTGSTPPTTDGSVVENEAATGFIYTPETGFTGADSFIYSISDGDGGIGSATVEITVSDGPNTDPVAANETFNVGEDDGAAEIGNILTNDTDADEDTLNVFAASVDGAALVLGTETALAGGGLLTVTDTGAVTFDPNGAFNGLPADGAEEVQIDYTVSDGNGGSDTATATIAIQGENDDPVAVDDEGSVGADETSTDVAVLDNDSDPDGDSLMISNISDPANGTAVEQDGGAIRYTPDAGTSGEDMFTYTITDPSGASSQATVTITVAAPGNNAPNAVDDTASTPEDMAVVVPAVGNDTDPEEDPLTITNITDPANGTAEEDPEAPGSILYSPDANFNGTDTFSYTITDGELSSTAEVTVTVEPVNDDPVANNNVVKTDFQTPITFDIVSDDTDVDNDTLVVTGIFDEDAPGAFVDNENGTVTFTPAAGFTGEVFAGYQISDGNGGTDFASINISVGAPGTRTVDVSILSQNEGNAGTTAFDFVLTRFAIDGPETTLDVTDIIRVTSEDITAVAGTDYTAIDETVVFAPGETTKTVTVSVIGDVDPEADEVFRLNLDHSGAFDNFVVPEDVTGTIRDDDAETGGKDLRPEDFDNVFLGSPDPDPHQGTADDDWMEGGDDRDNIFGGAGSDYIIAGPGNDWYVRGGEDGDYFQFGLGDGDVQIVDFVSGEDQICLDDGLSFEDLTQSIQVYNDITTVIFTTSNGDRLMLRDQDPDAITVADFEDLFDPGIKPLDPANFDNFFAATDGPDPHQGTEDNDWIEGGDDRDDIFGGEGSDYIIAGPGNDWYVRGGLDADWFQFGVGDGDIKIVDFEDGIDQICLDGITFDDLTQSEQVYNGITTVIFTTAAGDRLMLQDEDPLDITVDDFDFI